MVAPGIAEALLATAIGLVAAIPAVVIYNAFARGIGGYRALLDDTRGGAAPALARPRPQHAPRPTHARGGIAMAAKLSTGGETDELAETHDINVTPFIDVMLVLLIIFMVAAPLSTVDVNVDLPASSAAPAPRPVKPVFVTLKADRTIALGEDAVARDALGDALERATGGDRNKRIFVRADRSVSYGDLTGLMNVMRAVGYLKIGLVGLDAGKSGEASPAHAPAATASDRAR